MNELVAISTQCDQILLAIVSRLTTELVMVDLKIGGTATVLASPSISPQHPFAELPVRIVGSAFAEESLAEFDS